MPQAPLLWNQRLTKWLLDQGFVQCKKDKCVFTYDKNGSVIRLIVYVDDLAFAGNDPELINQFKFECPISVGPQGPEKGQLLPLSSL